MLGQDHADRRQLRHLMATEPPLQLPLLRGELPAAAPACRRKVIDDLIDVILRSQFPARVRMPALPARLAPLTLPRINSFALARASARRSARVFGGSDDGGLELVPRVLARLGLQMIQPLLQVPHPCRRDRE